MVVSNCTSPEVRRTKLSPLFINLISDQSRWVRLFKVPARFIKAVAAVMSMNDALNDVIALTILEGGVTALVFAMISLPHTNIAMMSERVDVLTSFQVRQGAFQSLGRFISTFANPSGTGLHFREDGTLLALPRCTLER